MQRSLQILTAHEKALTASPAKYPITRVEVRQYVVPSQTKSTTFDNAFTGQLPRRIFVGMVLNSSENGNLKTNPFNFQHFDLNYIACLVNGEQVPLIPYTPDFAKNEITREYRALFASLKQLTPRPHLNISKKSFIKGTTLFGFNLAPDYADGCNGHFNLIKRGSLRLELRFANNLANSINIVVYGEFDNIIALDKDRNVD